MLYRIVNRQFGYPMYASGTGSGWTDQESEALTFDDPEISRARVAYWNAVAKRAGLDGAEVVTLP